MVPGCLQYHRLLGKQANVFNCNDTGGINSHAKQPTPRYCNLNRNSRCAATRIELCLVRRDTHTYTISDAINTWIRSGLYVITGRTADRAVRRCPQCLKGESFSAEPQRAATREA